MHPEDFESYGPGKRPPARRLVDRRTPEELRRQSLPIGVRGSSKRPSVTKVPSMPLLRCLMDKPEEL
jgi:hypothetical protein